jgi:leucyl aminopeptidase
MNVHALVPGSQGLSAMAADALVLVLPAGERKPKLDDALLDGVLRQALKSGDLALKAGQALYLHAVDGLKAGRLLLIVAKDASPRAWRTAVDAALAQLKPRAVQHVLFASAAGELGAAHAEVAVQALGQARYVYRHTKPSAEAVGGLGKLSLACSSGQLKDVKAGLALGQAVANGVATARECANRPGNHCTPTWLGEEAQRVGKAAGLSVKVLDRKAIEKIGMGSFLSVTNGSDEPPRFIIMEYRGAGAKAAPVVLVGKGITFDTGGISLKPAAEMDEMKFDMGGAASVLGAMQAIAELKPKINVVALIPTCENMPSGRATKPGDVVTSLSGQTIEILNTDAEGRLILCDALTYAQRWQPAVIVDVATLTGACIIALGHHHAGMYANDDAVAEAMLAASKAALDPCWRMPLDEEYGDNLKSNFADLANVGPRAGGSITAAKFLQRFVGDTPWVHLDVAGVAHRSGHNKGATGRPVGLLTHFVLSRAARQ